MKNLFNKFFNKNEYLKIKRIKKMKKDTELFHKDSEKNINKIQEVLKKKRRNFVSSFWAYR